MALRVLLADESTTIKKVMQLALSDFGVEVRSVPVGLDVLSVAKSFKPDIVFADVLLTKRSGYEVCMDLKNDSETTHLPVVLMWSGFMEIDEQKAADCQADRRLEKPFDADHLRSIVDDLVPRTQSNPVSSYLNFPEMPEIQEEGKKAPQPKIAAVPSDEEVFEVAEYSENEPSIDLDALPEVDENGRSAFEAPLETEEEFSSVPLTPPTKLQEEIDEGGWAHQDLTKFKIQLPENDMEPQVSLSDIQAAEVSEDGDFEELTFATTKQKAPAPPAQQSQATQTEPATPSTPADFISHVEKSVKEQMMETLRKGPSTGSAKAGSHTQSGVDLDSNMVENLVREEARSIIEAICWKVLPEVAERIVREEISKILKETEKSI